MAWHLAYGRKRQLEIYGLTEETYMKLLADQNGGCAICGKTEGNKRRKRLAVDHDHESGIVRGLLCTTCNTRLGFLEKRWDAIMSYLKSSKSSKVA